MSLLGCRGGGGAAEGRTGPRGPVQAGGDRPGPPPHCPPQYTRPLGLASALALQIIPRCALALRFLRDLLLHRLRFRCRRIGVHSHLAAGCQAHFFNELTAIFSVVNVHLVCIAQQLLGFGVPQGFTALRHNYGRALLAPEVSFDHKRKAVGRGEQEVDGRNMFRRIEERGEALENLGGRIFM